MNIFKKNILLKYFLWLIIPELLFYSIDLIAICFDKFDIKMITHHILGYIHSYLLYTYIHKTWILYTLYIGFFLEQGCVTFSSLYLCFKDKIQKVKKRIYKLKLIKITKYLLICKACFTIYVIKYNDLPGYLRIIGNFAIIAQLCWSYLAINKDIRNKIKNDFINKMRLIIFLTYILKVVLTKKIGTNNDYKILIDIINCKINVKNLTNEKGVIFMSNHYTALDTFIIRTFTNNKTYCIIKSDIITQRKNSNIFIKLLSYIEQQFFVSTNAIVYKRNDLASGKKVKQQILEKIRNNENIIIFPEGSSTKNGNSKEFKNGIFHLASVNKIPIIPLTIKYSKDIGNDPGSKLNLLEWINNDVKIIIHNKIINKNFLELKNQVFNLIMNSKLNNNIY